LDRGKTNAESIVTLKAWIALSSEREDSCYEIKWKFHRKRYIWRGELWVGLELIGFEVMVV
jgi:hypothetical protein